MKSLKLFIAVLLTIATLTHSKPSQAAVGAAFSTPVLIAGIVIAGGGTAIAVPSIAGCKGDNSGLCVGLTIVILGPIILLGLVILDGEQQMEFRELNKVEASKLGVSASELVIYNSEIDQVNMLVADVKTELSKMEKPNAQDSAAAWNNVKELVSPATFSVMQKIASQK